MRRYALMGLIVLIIAGVAGGAYALIGRAKAADAQPSVFNVKVGETVEISLESNLTTGYSWTAKYDQTLLELVDDTFKEPTSGLMGAPGTQIFKFNALATGTAKVTFDYARPWEGEPADTAEYTIKIAR
jgi:inhibitor of cysteine peptidase